MSFTKVILPGKDAVSLPDCQARYLEGNKAEGGNPFDRLMNRALATVEFARPAKPKSPPQVKPAESSPDLEATRLRGAEHEEQATASDRPRRSKERGAATEILIENPRAALLDPNLATATVAPPLEPKPVPTSFPRRLETSSLDAIPCNRLEQGKETELSSSPQLPILPQISQGVLTAKSECGVAADVGDSIESEQGVSSGTLNAPDHSEGNPSGAESLTTAEGLFDPSQVEADRTSESSDRLDAQPLSAELIEGRGISGAQQYATMKQSEKAVKVAGSAEKVLPVLSAAVPNLDKTANADRLVVPLPRVAQSEETANATAPSSETLAAPIETSVAPWSAPMAEARHRVLDRTHDIVALHAMRLQQSGSDSLRVVIKPGAGMQISLELQARDGAVEVKALLHRGDLDFLNQHWPELQQRLEARGIRIASLSCHEDFPGSGGFQQPRQQHEPPDPLAAGAFAEFALAGSMTESPTKRAARAAANRGWETWA